MSTPRPEGGGPRPPDPGLCGRCRHARTTRGARGSVFFRCGLADRDARFVRYPPLPVRTCVGFQPDEARGTGPTDDPG